MTDSDSDTLYTPIPSSKIVSITHYPEPLIFEPSDPLELQNFHHFQSSHLKPWGWHVEIVSNKKTDYEHRFMPDRDNLNESESSARVKILTSPKVLGVELGIDDIRSFVLELSELRGRILTIPKVFKRILDYKSCRGAIMFGDYLTPLECRELVDKLAKCSTPFQCAHGRPSMTVLFAL